MSIEEVEGLERVIHSLKLRDVPPMWYELWPESESKYPTTGLTFLEQAYILETQNVLHLPAGAVCALLDTAELVQNNEDLSKVAWHCHRLLYHSHMTIDPWAFCMPRFDEESNHISGLFLTLVLLSGFEKLTTIYATRGISNRVLEDTLSDMALWMNHHHEHIGTWGLSNLWLYFHFSGRLYRIGRLQYALETFRADIRVYKNRATGEVVALSEPDIRYRRDGQVDGTANVFDPNGAWSSALRSQDNTIFGHPVSPSGYATHCGVKLKIDEWELVLSKGDPVLDIHIPEGERLSLTRCGESITRAQAFFTEHFPEFYFKAYTCSTWLFDAQFQKLLPHISNIVQFQREFYLFPVQSDGTSVFGRVFGMQLCSDLSNLPQDTQLQRAVVAHLKSGGHMRDAGGFILRDDLLWGTERYQKMNHALPTEPL